MDDFQFTFPAPSSSLDDNVNEVIYLWTGNMMIALNKTLAEYQRKIIMDKQYYGELDMRLSKL